MNKIIFLAAILFLALGSFLILAGNQNESNTIYTITKASGGHYHAVNGSEVLDFTLDDVDGIFPDDTHTIGQHVQKEDNGAVITVK